MIRYVRLTNYRSLVNFDVDFMKTKSIPKKMILIYGENGIGKSNFATSFYTLNETMRTMSSSEMIKTLRENRDKNESQEYMEYFEKFVKEKFKDINTIIEENKTIDSNDNMSMEFGFICNKKNGSYYIEMNDKEIVSEKLEFVINKNESMFFNIDKKNRYINKVIFTNKDYYKDFIELLDKYWGKHSFLSILAYELEDKKNDYIKNRISKSLYDALINLITICTKVKGKNHTEFGTIGTIHYLLNDFKEGKISIKKEKDLDKNENLLNEVFTNIYSDIKNVYYKRTIEDNFIKYKLYCKKLIFGKIKEIDFSLESTGTQNILSLIPYLVSACEGQMVVIDELDTGIHDLLVKTLLECIYKYVKGQLIITTHNTMLMNSSIPKDDIYVFNVDSDAKKELIAITDYDERIQKNNNPQNKYLKGMYGGVPMFSDIDFEEIINNLG